VSELSPSVRVWRVLHPSARRTSAPAIMHSGGKQTVFECVCGATHTCATSHRDAKHVTLWRVAHRNCIKTAISAWPYWQVMTALETLGITSEELMADIRS